MAKSEKKEKVTKKIALKDLKVRKDVKGGLCGCMGMGQDAPRRLK